MVKGHTNFLSDRAFSLVELMCAKLDIITMQQDVYIINDSEINETYEIVSVEILRFDVGLREFSKELKDITKFKNFRL